MRYVDLSKSKISADKKNIKKKKRGIKFLIVVFFLLIAGIFVLFFGKKVIAIFDPIAIVSSMTSTNLKEADGRTNILLLGSDKRSVGDVKSVLTDTILVVSLGRVEGNIVLISLPRDLWVTAPNGTRSKINAVYARNPETGTSDVQKVVEDVLGLPIHYYSVVDFAMFRETINILGGIEVNVDNSFDDFYYPVEGKENALVESEKYETVHFEKGVQKMNGELALKYVRSRKGSNGEGTDFARSKRQQEVILAIKDKFLSLETLIDPVKLGNLYETYSKNVDTNIDLSTAQGFYLLSQRINFNNFRTVVLDDRSTAASGGLLYEPEDKSLYGGAYVLIPKAGDFSQLHAYVQKYIFGD